MKADELTVFDGGMCGLRMSIDGLTGVMSVSASGMDGGGLDFLAPLSREAIVRNVDDFFDSFSVHLSSCGAGLRNCLRRMRKRMKVLLVNIYEFLMSGSRLICCADSCAELLGERFFVGDDFDFDALQELMSLVDEGDSLVELCDDADDRRTMRRFNELLRDGVTKVYRAVVVMSPDRGFAMGRWIVNFRNTVRQVRELREADWRAGIARLADIGLTEREALETVLGAVDDELREFSFCKDASNEREIISSVRELHGKGRGDEVTRFVECYAQVQFVGECLEALGDGRRSGAVMSMADGGGNSITINGGNFTVMHEVKSFNQNNK